MAQILYSLQISSAILLIVLVLLQRSNSGETPSMGDTGSFFQTRRGSERFFFVLTIIVAILFAGSSLGVLVFG